MLETLCALSVLTITAFGATQLYVDGYRATKDAQEELAAARLLANELDAWRAAASAGLRPEEHAALRTAAAVPSLESLKGHVKVSPAAAGPSGLFEVSVRLRWKGVGGRTLHRSATTLVAAAGATP